VLRTCHLRHYNRIACITEQPTLPALGALRGQPEGPAGAAPQPAAGREERQQGGVHNPVVLDALEGVPIDAV
jgi:hypothetical protein